MMTMMLEMWEERHAAVAFCAKTKVILFHLITFALTATYQSILYARLGIQGRKCTFVFSATKRQR
eukprot:10494128-Ditylum_brightwellii.AAC.1